MALLNVRSVARTRSTRSAAAAVAATLVLAACVPQRPEERLVEPGLRLDTAHLTEGTTRWRVTVVQDTVKRDMGVMTSSTSFVDYDGLPAVLLVRTSPTERGVIVDSVLSLRHTLAPVWQHSHQPTRTMLLDFANSGVTGEWAPADSAMRKVHHPTGRPVFDATSQGLLVTSLPLADGYRTLLPIYSFELAGMEIDTLQVLGTEQVSAPDGSMRDAWKIGFYDPFVTATIWVDQQARRILREDIVSRRTGATFREVPLS